MKKVMAWLAALCLLALSVAGALTTAAAGNTAGTAVSGLVHDADGRIRYYENGVPVAKGLVRDDEGNVYYIWNAVNGAARGMFSIPEDKLNGIMPQGFYEFGADYRMIVKNGIYTHDWCDHTYYFVNSVPEAVGLAKNEDGDILLFHYHIRCQACGDGRRLVHTRGEDQRSYAGGNLSFQSVWVADRQIRC